MDMRGDRARSPVVALALTLTLVSAMAVVPPMAAGGGELEVPRVPFNMEVLGNVPGVFADAQAAGGVLYAVGGQTLSIWDVTTGVTESADLTLYEQADTVWLDTDRVYAVGENGFSIVDVTDPAAPELLGTARMPGDAYVIVGFYVIGDYAYSAYQKHDSTGMKIFDISDPGEPVIVGYSELGFWDLQADVVGQYAFVTTDFGFEVIDNSTPTCPEVVAGADEVPPYPTDVVVEGTDLYVAYGYPAAYGGVVKFDVTTPLDPLPLGDFEGTPTDGLAVSGPQGYALGADGAVSVLNVSLPATPTLLGVSAPVVGALGVTADGPFAFVPFADGEAGVSGIAKIDATTPGAPVVLPGATGLPGAYALDLAGTVAYVGYAGGLATVDVSEPGTPTVLGELATPSPVLDIDVEGTTAYLALGSDGLWVADVTDATTPGYLGGLAPDGEMVALDASGTVVYSVDETGIRTIDVTVPTSPWQWGYFETGVPAQDIEVLGERAYVALGAYEPLPLSGIGELGAASGGDYGTALVAFDISYPGGPVPVADHGIPSAFPRVAIDSERAYVQGLDPDWGGSYVKTFDVSDPDALDYTAYSGVERWTTDVDVADHLMFTASGRDVQVRAVSDPAAPLLVGDMPVGADSVHAEGGLVLAAHEHGGLYVMEYDPVSMRDYGGSRYDTAADLAEDFASSEYVIIATGLDFPDGLTAAPLAYALDAPILLVAPGYIPGSVETIITELGSTKAYVIGGEAALSATVVDELEALGMASGDITRIGGENRYDTARLTALELDAVTGGDGIGLAFVGTGLNFPDTLAASSIAARKGAPILLTAKDRLPDETAEALVSLGTTRTIVLGGPNAVSDDVLALLPNPTRLDGSTRYDTAKTIADWALDEAGAGFDPASLFVATGLNFPDAMAAGVVAARHDAAMILVGADVPPATETFFSERRDAIEEVTIVGGPAAVSTDVERILVGLLR